MNDKDENYWKDKLSPEQYKVLREKATEAPFTGELLNNKQSGTYVCAGCGADLFSSSTKFESGSGWPNFYDVVGSRAVNLEDDSSHGMRRTEAVCASCGGHLGHVFDDGPKDATGQRYCINSMSLDFKEKDKDA